MILRKHTKPVLRRGNLYSAVKNRVKTHIIPKVGGCAYRNYQRSLFYENMQGKGKEGTPSDKRQVVANTLNKTEPTYPNGGQENNEAWKDAKPYGTYIEVDAFMFLSMIRKWVEVLSSTALC